ncbi:hypothetical protein ACP70R_034563 [Stipagrostis hirtigluma subsp. patula]
MLPGPLLPAPPPPQLVLIGLPSVPTASPSDPPSLSIGSSLAIIVIILIATVTVTICIALLCRGCRQRRPSCSSFSPRRSFSPMASVSSSSSAIGASPRDRTAMSSLEIVGVSSAPMDAVKRVMDMSGVKTLVPSAPSLPEVERVILELLSLPSSPIKPGSSTICIICNREFLPTDVLLVLPVCLHTFHQSCIVTWLRRATSLCCPSCHVYVVSPEPDKTSGTLAFCSDDYDIESQMLVPAPPGEKVAEAVGGSRGWLRSSLDRLSGSWRGCSSNRATAVVAPLSSRPTSGSWNLGSSGRLRNDSYCTEPQMPLAVPTVEVSQALGSSHGWLRSSLATLSGSWSRCSSSSAAMELPVSSRSITRTLGSSGDSSIQSWPRSWDLEAAKPAPERPSVYDYVRWVFRSSG